MPAVIVLPGISLDDQSGAEVHKVEHIRSQRLLAAEFLSTQPVGAQMAPEHVLGVGHSAPQLTGEGFLVHGVRALLEWAPPLPLGERGRVDYAFPSKKSWAKRCNTPPAS